MQPGSWPSPLSARALTQGTVKLREIQWGNGWYWLEGHPDRGGAQQICRWDGGPEPVTPPDVFVGSKIHEYGGSSFAVHEGVVYYAEAKQGDIWKVVPGQSPTPLTRTGWRFGDFTFHPEKPVAIAVCERPGDEEPENLLVQIHLETGEVTDWRRGADFYAHPRFCPAGDEVAWVEWLHPDMPWDETTLRASPWPHTDAMRIAGSAAIFQPQWSPQGELTYVADYTGWWNLYQDDDAIVEKEAEFGLPLWNLAMSTYGFLGDDILACYVQGGLWNLGRISEGKLTPIPNPYSLIETLRTNQEDEAAFFAASPTQPKTLVQWDGTAFTPLRPSAPTPKHLISEPEPLSFPTGQGERSHGFYYPPARKDFEGLAPLLVMCHGGPTGATTVEYDLEIQYWTSRGFGVLDVNYRGSTGYGRTYRERLYGGWGVVDVEDVVAGAQFLVETSRAHADRVAIRGRSAGGLTVLGALASSNVFRAGVSYYGVTDLKALQEETHKFESHYNQTLIGSVDADTLTNRSPSSHLDQIRVPVLFFQGLEDPVVPPGQARSMAEGLRSRGVPTALVEFAGEAHGFRQAATIESTLELETAFYRKVFGLEDPEGLPPVPLQPPL